MDMECDGFECELFPSYGILFINVGLGLAAGYGLEERA